MRHAKIELVQEYFRLLERFASDPASFERILHSEFQQREFPNLLNRKGQESDLADTLRRADLGRKMLSAQSYTITHFVECEDQVVVEASWNGKMAVAAGPLQAGQELHVPFVDHP